MLWKPCRSPRGCDSSGPIEARVGARGILVVEERSDRNEEVEAEADSTGKPFLTRLDRAATEARDERVIAFVCRPQAEGNGCFDGPNLGTICPRSVNVSGCALTAASVRRALPPGRGHVQPARRSSPSWCAHLQSEQLCLIRPFRLGLDDQLALRHLCLVLQRLALVLGLRTRGARGGRRDRGGHGVTGS